MVTTNSENPLVSICIPNYNNGIYLGQAIESALNQTIVDLEVIVIDNLSNDNSMEVANSFSDTRLKVYQNEKNIGMYGNFQRVAELATGTYLKFLAADDWLEPTYLEVTLPHFDDESVGLVTTRQAKYDDTLGIVGYRKEPVINQVFYTGEQMLMHFLRDANPIGNPTRVIIPRSVFETLGGFDLNLDYCNDLDLWLRILERFNVCAVPSVHCVERKHGGQHTKRHAKLATDIINIFYTYQKSFASIPGFWTQERKSLLCREGMKTYVRLGLKQALYGNKHYLMETFKCLNEVAPKSTWYIYHLVTGYIYIIYDIIKNYTYRFLSPSQRANIEVLS